MGFPVKKVVFMGSPAFAVPSLNTLISEGFNVIAVYTQPPRPAGRGQKIVKTPVHFLADEKNIPVYTPERLKGDNLSHLVAMDFDAICVVAYGLLLPKVLVERAVCLNIHPSALPKYRGAAPIQRTVMKGETSTEVCIMRLEAGMDTGPVYKRHPLDIPKEMTAGMLHDVCADIGARDLVEVLRQLPDITAIPQVGEPTFAAKITADDRVVDFGRPAREIYNQIRGLSPYPGAHFTLRSEAWKIGAAEVRIRDSEVRNPKLAARERCGSAPKRAEVISVDGGLSVMCADGNILCMTKLQRPGKTMMDAVDVLRGGGIAVGDVLGS